VSIPLNIGQPRLYGEEVFQKYHRQGDWGQELLVDHFDAQVARAPDKPAIVEAHRTLSYAQVQSATLNIAAALLSLGVVQGDVVAVQSPNWAELPIVHLATDRIGAIFLPLSEGFREKELRHLLATARVKVLFCPAQIRSEDHLSFVSALRPHLPDLLYVIAMRAQSKINFKSTGNFETFDVMAADNRWGHPARACMAGEGKRPCRRSLSCHGLIGFYWHAAL
jgi:non-ribosomal peptide synthetase component E (peptide arylation enzyme)